MKNCPKCNSTHSKSGIKHNVVGPDDLYKVADWLRNKI